jgi:hypothetical protein
MKGVAAACAIALCVNTAYGVSPKAQPKYEVGKWAYQDLQDKMNDQSRGIAILRNSGGTTAGLIFKCDSQRPQNVYAQITVANYIGDVSESGDYRDLTYRVDANPPKTIQVLYGDNDVLIRPGATLNQFASDVATGKHLVVRARNYKFEAVEAEFDLGNAGDAIKHVAAVCKSDSPV